jgi:hypothetical protein
MQTSPSLSDSASRWLHLRRRDVPVSLGTAGSPSQPAVWRCACVIGLAFNAECMHIVGYRNYLQPGLAKAWSVDSNSKYKVGKMDELATSRLQIVQQSMIHKQDPGMMRLRSSATASIRLSLHCTEQGTTCKCHPGACNSVKGAPWLHCFAAVGVFTSSSRKPRGQYKMHHNLAQVR